MARSCRLRKKRTAAEIPVNRILQSTPDRTEEMTAVPAEQTERAADEIRAERAQMPHGAGRTHPAVQRRNELRAGSRAKSLADGVFRLWAKGLKQIVY